MGHSRCSRFASLWLRVSVTCASPFGTVSPKEQKPTSLFARRWKNLAWWSASDAHSGTSKHIPTPPLSVSERTRILMTNFATDTRKTHAEWTPLSIYLLYTCHTPLHMCSTRAGKAQITPQNTPHETSCNAHHHAPVCGQPVRGFAAPWPCHRDVPDRSFGDTCRHPRPIRDGHPTARPYREPHRSHI